MFLPVLLITFRLLSAAAADCATYHKEVKPPSSVTAVKDTACYNATSTKARYETIGWATVETQRGCEVLCTANKECFAFSFKDAGFSSSCVLLSSTIIEQSCQYHSHISVKKTHGCVARTNITAEFGADPCIDKMVSSAFRGIDKWTICQKEKNNLYIVRAIDASGRRITLDNDDYNYIRKSGDMFEFIYESNKKKVKVVPIVAATCALAGPKKCACEPLKHLSIKDTPTYPAKINKANPCNGTDSQLWFDVAKSAAYGTKNMDAKDTAKSFVKCMAGMWVVWKESTGNMWGVDGLGCAN